MTRSADDAYISAVNRTAVALLLITLLLHGGGCTATSKYARTPSEAQLFAPVSMRIHPIFTQVKDWTGDGVVDGIEALLEFQDQFTDPTKAAGGVVFELFAYRPYSPEARGERVLNPWVGSLRTVADQEARWNRTSRTYSFELEYPEIREDRDYVLAATFDTGHTRFFDQIILEGRRTPRDQRVPATQPGGAAGAVSHATTRP
ncbi:MAG: hypothetical protein QOE14_412 [Humisphaera sp.]|nr:hypothetical protein [Humisphaera sp.]